MNEFNKLCKTIDELDPDTYTEILADKSAKVIPALAAISEDGLSGVTIFANFILGAVVADGKLTEEEYLLALPLFKVFFGDSVNYDDCKMIVKKMGNEAKELKNALDEMVDVLGQLSEDLKDDIIIICMLICSIDGKISAKEKSWIKQLID